MVENHDSLSGLWHHSISQLYYGFLRSIGCMSFVWRNEIPRASPSEYHFTTLRVLVQYPYTLEKPLHIWSLITGTGGHEGRVPLYHSIAKWYITIYYNFIKIFCFHRPDNNNYHNSCDCNCYCGGDAHTHYYTCTSLHY